MFSNYLDINIVAQQSDYANNTFFGLSFTERSY